MLKRITSLILVLIVGGSVLAASVRPMTEHVCQMAGAAVTDMHSMPCCERSAALALEFVPPKPESCCVLAPQETSSNGMSFNLQPPILRLAVVHPTIRSASPVAPKPNADLFAAVVFLPDRQSSYIRNLTFLI